MTPERTETLCSNDIEEPPSFEINLTINDDKWRKVIVDIETIIERSVASQLSYEHCSKNSIIAIVLSNDAEVQTMNRDFRHKDKPTNVLSFPDEEEGVLGDIILSLDTLMREAEEQKKPFQHHLIHMLTHGTLHLLGHDHEEDDEAAIMEAREISFLDTLNIPNPYNEV